MRRSKVRKAILPVAGLGTRFLPVTKAIPKEILPLVDRPLIQYAIDEARAAGIEEFIFVTSRGKSALEDYFDTDPRLVELLRHDQKFDLLAELKRADMPSGAIAYVRQNQALGLGHAIWCARHMIGNEPFAVLLPDDVIAAQTPCLQQMTEAHAEIGGTIVAAMEVPRASASSYGILDASAERGRVLRVKNLVEKPTPETAPSNLAVIGRYILNPEIFSALSSQSPGAGGEIQLTDAIAKQTGKQNVFGFRFEGTRYDCGTKAGFLQATVAFALARDELRDELSRFLRSTINLQVAAE